MPVRLDSKSADFETAFTEILAAQRESDADVNETVAAILADVRARGDAAVLDYTARFDHQSLSPERLRISSNEIEAATAQCTTETLDALTEAANRIESFHAKQFPENLEYYDEAGVHLGLRWTPIAAVGLYVPGGLAAYPSSVLMNALPAKVAGVARVAMVVPTPGGVLNPLVLAAAKICGIDEIYRIGGAQAIGALAYGTPSIAPVDKIVGPGNAYVAAAKRQVFGTVGIDMIAGPSEILVVADGQNDPAWIAMDLLSQAEHDPSAQSILITDDAAFADAVEVAIRGHLQTLPKADIAGQSWENHGAIITVSDLKDAYSLVDRIAPEHLELALEYPNAFAAHIHNAGAMFLGRHTPEAVGDYVAGPNHVLPTSRSARFSSGLGVLDFMKRTTFIQCDAESLGRIGPAAVTLARAEGLDAHGNSVALRLNLPRGG